ncbi:MAG: hypothetical protein KHW53_06285 [Veillonella sp.]|uniref:hypothetical protein n=1 Tax=Veillonella sp. TaxID=1926307 RepID=UPI00257A1243|nr:hypothetical protein [Veillonella sp.]MBS5756257.1 hypothetical protein [Veillonella sp.]
MNKPSGLAAKLRALLKAKETPMWAVIIVLIIGSTVDSVAGRLYILEGMANKHSDQIEELQKYIRQLQNDSARYDWELKQLEWLHPELKVISPDGDPNPLKSTDLNLDMNPGKVPDVKK